MGDPNKYYHSVRVVLGVITIERSVQSSVEGLEFHIKHLKKVEGRISRNVVNMIIKKIIFSIAFILLSDSCKFQFYWIND